MRGLARGHNVPEASVPPSDPLAGAILLLDASKGRTITGSGVSLWEDQSVSGYDLSMAVDADRPGYDATGGPNGKPAVIFDLANTEYLSGSGILSMKTTYTIVAALDVNNLITTDTCLVAGNAVAFCPTRTSQVGMVDTNSWLCGAAQTGPQVLTWVYDGGLSITCYRNGVLLGAAGTGVLGRELGQMRLGAYSLGLMHCNADLSELVIFDNVKTAVQLAALHAYLVAKYIP